MFRAEIASDEAEDASGLDARQGRQRSMTQFLPEQVKGFYRSSVLYHPTKKVIEPYFYTSIVGEIGKYLYAFPWSLYFLAVVVVACLFTLCSRPIINRLSKISLPEYLKANH